MVLEERRGNPPAASKMATPRLKIIRNNLFQHRRAQQISQLMASHYAHASFLRQPGKGTEMPITSGHAELAQLLCGTEPSSASRSRPQRLMKRSCTQKMKEPTRTSKMATKTQIEKHMKDQVAESRRPLRIQKI